MSEFPSLYAGGYFLSLTYDRQEYLPVELSPTKIISASKCQGTIEISSWCGADINELGIPESKLSELEEWSATAFEKEYGYPNVFYNLSAARHYVKTFITNPPDNLVILCPALRPELAEEIFKDKEPEPNRGTYDSLARHNAPEKGGIRLGYEVLGYDYDIEHSCWCYYTLITESFEKYKIKPNENGFLITSMMLRK